MFDGELQRILTAKRKLPNRPAQSMVNPLMMSWRGAKAVIAGKAAVLPIKYLAFKLG